MTVKELKEFLSTVDEDLNVWIFDITQEYCDYEAKYVEKSKLDGIDIILIS